MKRSIIALFILSTLLLGCTSSNDFETGKRQLESQGYTNVVNTGYNMFCCGEDDGFSTGFKAKDSKGREVSGCFCSSIGKGITIRFD